MSDPSQKAFKPSSTWRSKFANAFRGIRLGVSGQSSFAVHGVATTVVAAMAVWLQVEPLEWCVLLLTIGLVLTAEFLNSSLERLAKAVTEEHHPHVGAALDIASGAVLTSAGIAVAIGVVIFAPRLLALFAAT